MKKNVILLVMLFQIIPNQMFAFLDDDKNWTLSFMNYFYKEQHYGMSHQERYIIQGKETVGDKEYYIMRYMLATFDSNSHDWDYTAANINVNDDLWDDWWDSTYNLHVREDSGIVYVLEDDYNVFCKWRYGGNPYASPVMTGVDGEIVLYDFNLRPGDAYPMPGNVIVETTGWFLVGGVEYRYQKLSNSILIVDGIGCINSYGGIIAYQSAPLFIGNDIYATFFSWMVVDDSAGKHFEYAIGYDPKVFLGINDTSTKREDKYKDDSIYSIQGRRVSGTLRPGIYIRGGRKVVVK